MALLGVGIRWNQDRSPLLFAAPAAVYPLAWVLAIVPHTVLAAPSGGQLISGAATISQSASAGKTATTIVQTSAQASLNWQSFNVAAGETVSFVQPSASALAINRIADVQGSQIWGQIKANGQVWLINPNGVLFGQSAQINVGALVASTLEVRDAGASAASFGGSSGASVRNWGSIQTPAGGYVALLGHQIDNQGSISTPQGASALAAGNAVRLQFGDNKLLGLEVQENQWNALVANAGIIQADGGQVLLSAGARDSLLASVVNNTGVVQARTLGTQGGRIVLLGGMAAGKVQVAGSLDASAPQGGDGGFIETSAASVHIADTAQINTLAANGQTGSWLLDPSDFTVASSGGDITGIALSAMLATTNAGIALPSSAAANITINDAITWGSAYSLTLNAQGSIYINAPIKSTHSSGKLILKYGQSGAYYVNAPVSLAAGVGNFQTQQGTGTLVSYTVLTALGTKGDTSKTTLQGMAGGLSGNYALGADIDAAATGDLNAWLQDPTGWLPIGTSGNPFSGQFEGLGHAVSNLFVYRTGSPLAGFFGQTKSTANIRNVGLVDVYIRDYNEGSYLGGLVGLNYGTISNTYVTGLVRAAKPGVGTPAIAYGLGGLVGTNAGTISNSYSTASISTIVPNTADLGSQLKIGALVGVNTGTIRSSYAAGEFFSNGSAGFVGLNSGTVASSYWESKTSSAPGTVYSLTGNTVLAGADTNPLSQAAYTALDFASTWTMYGGYSRPLLRTFLTPVNLQLVAGSAKVYDGTTDYAAGSYSYTPTGTKRILGSPYYFLDGKDVGNHVLSVAGLYSDQQGYLITIKPATSLVAVTKRPLTVSANNASKTYGDANPALSATLSGFVNGENLASSGVSGAASLSTSATQASGVGSYTISAGIGSLSASNYDFSNFVDGALSISKASLTVRANNASKTYGDANPTLSATLSGFVNGENLASSGVSGAASLSTSATSSSGVGSYTISASIGSLSASNYDFSNLVDGALSIGQRPITIVANQASKTYGDPNPLLTYEVLAAGMGSSRGLVGADRFSGSLGTVANAQSGPGLYVIDASLVSNSNYLISTQNAILTVKPRVSLQAEFRENLTPSLPASLAFNAKVPCGARPGLFEVPAPRVAANAGSLSACAKAESL